MNAVKWYWSQLNHRFTDTFLAECFAMVLEPEPQELLEKGRHILNTNIC